MKKAGVLAIISVMLFANMAISAESIMPEITLSVNTEQVVGQIDERIYGHFLEHIYHSVNGGLWGELVWNRSFEFRPLNSRHKTADDPNITADSIGMYWAGYGPGTVGCVNENPLNSNYCVRVAPAAEETGVFQTPFALHQGETYRGSLWARGGGRLTVRLLDGQTVLAESTLGAASLQWKEFPIVLKPSADADNAVLQIGVIGEPTWIDQISIMPDSWQAAGGFRPDLLKALSDLHPPILRWPGGSFANKYRWKSGIGPQHQRVSFPSPMWDDLEVNAFGTDEFVAMCRKIQTEPVMVVCIGQPDHMAQRDAYCREAAEWVEYCNGPSNSTWGKVRAANGHPEPYRIKYWEIDNEVWKVDPTDYASLVRQYAAAMKKVDPSITIIACGSGQLGGRWHEGDLAVIRQAAQESEFLSIHHYENIKNYGTGPANDEAFWKILAAEISGSKNPEMKLFVSEWNLQSTDWRTGLYAGGILNAFERNPIVGMATPALLFRHVSARKWDNAFINFDHRTWFPAPNYVVTKLYRDHYLPQRVQVEGDTNGLNVIATRSFDSKQVVLKIVNPTENSVNMKVIFEGNFNPAKATLHWIAPGSLDTRNTLEQPDAVRTVSGEVRQDGTKVILQAPRLSVGLLKVQ
ncbi:MAG TPA: alpha-L-arabinofuranosidase C-terminal domain-containing protein [Anaerohalosphaeraceae bacterium]|nr:alpha-L-arabinofuranosidase C-terminal domain-containing protein [Anaerohalosphaeraceae bacterium]